MTTLTCAQLSDVAPELALGTLPGRQRAAALAHLDRCSDCRLTVEELSDAADALLLAAPQAAPPPGFARHVTEGFVTRRPRRWRAIVRVAAVAAAALAIAGGSLVTLVGRQSTPSRPSFALQKPGVRMTHFVPVTDEELHGDVFASADRPSWVFMTVQDDGSSDAYRCQVQVANGQWIDVGTFQLHDGAGSWGKAVTTDLHQLKAVRLIDEQGSVAASASLA
jgi:predicted anti-sigma-YlaC factor YlaD